MVLHILFTHSSINGYLGCFHILAIMSYAAVNIYVQVFMWTYVFTSLVYMYRGVELLGHTVILCVTIRGTTKLFAKDCTILRSHQQCVRVRFSTCSTTLILC